MSLLSSNLQKALEYEAEMACPGREINNKPFAKNTPSFKVNWYNSPRNVSAHSKEDDGGASNFDHTSKYWEKALKPWWEVLKPFSETK